MVKIPYVNKSYFNDQIKLSQNMPLLFYDNCKVFQLKWPVTNVLKKYLIFIQNWAKEFYDLVLFCKLPRVRLLKGFNGKLL